MKEFVRSIMQLGVIWLICLSLFSPQPASASEGNIDDTYKYAWSENSGWQNFRPDYGGVCVHDKYLSGYAWAENIGWVKLGSGTGPYANTTSSNWGVNRDSATGVLSGYAWSENAGWINFNPSGSQVTIDTSTGKFDGYAWAENAGWIHFQNASPEYYVQAATSTATLLIGSWNTSSTWQYGIIPDASQDVTISHNVDLDTTGNTKDLTIEANKTLTFSETNQLTIAGNASITGTMDVAGGSCSAAGTTTVSGELAISTGTYTANGSFDASGGNVTFTGTGTLYLNAAAEACGSTSFGTLSTDHGTVDYAGACAQNVVADTYHNLKLSGGAEGASVTKTLCSAITVAGHLNIANQYTTLDVSGSNHAISVAGNWSNSGAFTCQAGTVTFTGSGNSTLAPGDSSFYKLTLNKSASGEKLLPGADLTVSNAFTITKGTFDLDTNDVNLSLGGALDIGADGRWLKSSDSAKTVTFTGAGSTIADSSSPLQNLGYVKVE